MRKCIATVRPNAVVHLGDHYDDAQALQEENPQIPFHMLPGNCDRYRCAEYTPQILCYPVCGVRLYMTHGHLHGVKSDTYRLIIEARKTGAQAALYGHTHQADCHEEPDGLWVLNPGSSGYGGSAGVIEVQENKISVCSIIKQTDLGDT